MKNIVDIQKTLIPKYIQELKLYQPGKAISELAREKNLHKISKLASNENPLGPSPQAIKEMTSALWDIHQYPDMHAFKLKSTLAAHYHLKQENIILGNGSEGIMADIMRTFIRPGDEVVTCEKTFHGFTNLAKAVGSFLKTVPLTSDYRFNVEALSEAITPQTKLVYIANPNNPTGNYITKKEFDFLMEVIPEYCLVILDEAYFEYAKGHHPDYPDSMDYRYDNVITLRTFSKAYGLAGIRIGYGFAHDYLISNLNKIRLPFGPNLLGQVGAYGALKDQSHLHRSLENNSHGLKRLLKYLKSHEFHSIPSATNFITFSAESEAGALWINEHMLNQGVIIRPLKSNDMPEHLRVSIGSVEEMDHFYEAMDGLLDQFDTLFRLKRKTGNNKIKEK